MKLKRAVLMLTLFCFVASVSAFAATEVTPSATSFIIEVDVGADYAGSEVSVVVLAPAKDISDIPARDDGTGATIVPYVDQQTVAANGKANFTYTPAGTVAGRFTIITACKDAAYKEEHVSAFVSYGSVVSLIKSLADTTDIADLFEVPEDPDVLAGYEILGFDSLKEYNELFKDDSLVTGEVKTKIYADLLKVKNAGLTVDQEKSEFQLAFSDSVLRNIVYVTKDTEKLRSFIDTYKGDLGIDEVAQFTSLYNGSRLGEDGKNDVISRMTAYDWSDESLAEICGVFAECCFLTAIDVDYFESYEDLAALVESESAYLEANGADMEAYAEADSSDVCRELSSALAKNKIKNLDDFVKTLNKLTDSEDTSSGGTSSGGGSKRDSDNLSALAGLGGVSVPQLGQGTEATPSVYSDIAGADWALESIEALSELGVLSGKGDGKFYPNDNVTRAEFAKMITLAFGLYNETAQCKFADVAGDAWYYSYVASAYENGIITGYDSSYAPNATITREDAAVIVARVLGQETASEAESFTDDSSIADYAKTAVYLLRERGIINGVSETEFAPKAMISRAQAAKIIYGALQIKGGE